MFSHREVVPLHEQSGAGGVGLGVAVFVGVEVGTTGVEVAVCVTEGVGVGGIGVELAVGVGVGGIGLEVTLGVGVGDTGGDGETSGKNRTTMSNNALCSPK